MPTCVRGAHGAHAVRDIGDIDTVNLPTIDLHGGDSPLAETAFDERASETKAKRNAASTAAAWCRTHGKTATEAISSGLFAGATLMMVRSRPLPDGRWRQQP